MDNQKEIQITNHLVTNIDFSKLSTELIMCLVIAFFVILFTIFDYFYIEFTYE